MAVGYWGVPTSSRNVRPRKGGRRAEWGRPPASGVSGDGSPGPGIAVSRPVSHRLTPHQLVQETGAMPSTASVRVFTDKPPQTTSSSASENSTVSERI